MTGRTIAEAARRGIRRAGPAGTTAAAVAGAILAVALLLGLLCPANVRDVGPGRGDADLVAVAEPHLDGVRRSVSIVAFGPETSAMAHWNSTMTSPYAVGTMSRAWTAALYRQAVARWLDPSMTLGEAVPDFADDPVGAVPLSEIATHTAGFADVDAPWGIDRAGLVALAEADPLDGRGQVRPSRLGDAVLGLAVAEAAGATEGAPDASYPRLLRELVAEPVGARRTGVPTSPDMNPPTGLTESGATVPTPPADAFAPARGVVSTPLDMALLARVTLAAASRPGHDGLLDGFGPDPDRPQVLVSEGRAPGFRTMALLDPARRVAVVVMSDSEAPIDGLARAVLDAFADGSVRGRPISDDAGGADAADAADRAAGAREAGPSGNR